MNRNWIVIGVLAAVLLAMLGAAVHHERFRSAHPGFSSGAKGKTAPDFALADVKTGQTVRLSDFRGKPVLLNFWATWCPPCKVEIPWFVDLQNEYGAQGLTIIGVAMDDAGKDKIAEFAHEMNMNYAVLLGDDKTADAYGGVENLPTTFYIARDGRVVKRVFGLVGQNEIEDNIKALLSSGQATAQARAGN